MTTPATASATAADRAHDEPGPAAAVLDFEQVFAEMAPYVLRVLPRMGVAPSDRDDVAQEIFLAVHSGLRSFEGRSQLRTWVYGICIRRCSDYRRKAHRRRETLTAEPPHGIDAAASPERQLAQQRSLQALDAALSELPSMQRSVFVLFEIEGLDMHEVAAALGCSKFTAYARLYAARRGIARALRDQQPGEAP